MELVATYCIVEVSGPTVAAPGPGCEVPRPGTTAAVLEMLGEVPGPTTAAPGPGCEVPEPGATAAVPEPDPTVLGAAFTKMDYDSGEGLIDGLHRHWRETPAGMACRVEPMRARVSVVSLSARGTWMI